MKKVLHLFTTLDGGGVESFLYNYYMHMDHKEVNFDAIVPGEQKGYMEEDFINRGSQIFHIKRLKEDPIQHIKAVFNIIKKGNYDIIHCHGYKSVEGLILAKFLGCNVRIIHSHMAYVSETVIQRFVRKIAVQIAKMSATDLFACGIDAAKWLFGETSYIKGKVTIINNAIDIEKYKYNSTRRKEIRRKLDLEGELVIGNVARLTYQKNQEFLLDIMNEIVKKIPNAKLLLVGSGEDKINLQKKAEELCIKKNVNFLGLRKDIPDLLSAMDVFVLPSRFEGLPVVLAEVQAAGLPAVVADTVTKEINVTNSISYVSLEDGARVWAQIIENEGKTDERERLKIGESMKKGKYDIQYQANILYKNYIQMINRKKG